MQPDRVRRELSSFEQIWKGGFYIGNPMSPMGVCNYNHLGYMSVLHVVYLCCIRPYVTSDTTVLEIGPGRGAWTKTMLDAKRVICLDALDAKHNGFWEYVGHNPRVEYFKVDDFSLSMVPDNSIDHFFSFDALVHVSFEGISEYMRNLRAKLRSGANGFMMVADYDKYNAAVANNMYFTELLTAVTNSIPLPLRYAYKLLNRINRRHCYDTRRFSKGEDDHPRPGRWYHAGTKETCAMLRTNGFIVVEEDMSIDHRNPIIHFTA